MFGHTNEPVTISRDVDAIIIPVGEKLTLREGTTGFITQALGGSFTIYVEGNLFRIAGADADALGEEPVPPPDVPENPTDEDIEAVIWAQLRTCYDPEIPVNIVDLGLIYRCEVKSLGNGERSVEVDIREEVVHRHLVGGSQIESLAVEPDVRDRHRGALAVHDGLVEGVREPLRDAQRQERP